MTGEAHRAQELARWTDEKYAYLTTTGRKTGQAHRIEMWFAVENGRVFMLSGGRDRSDWVRNLKANPEVTLELGDTTHSGTARILPSGTDDDQRARELLVAKYRDGDNLVEWGRNSLAVVIEFANGNQSGNSSFT